MKYVLITPVRNEGAFIEGTLASVAAQTVLPERWVIVNDGSTDQTGEIIDGYAARHNWMEVIHRPAGERRSFAGKAGAFSDGFNRVKSLEFDVVGNLDADLSFGADYFEFLMTKFAEDTDLGVAGTPFIEGNYDSSVDSFEGKNHVAGGCQLFRRACFEEIGGYVAHPGGGIDWIAVTTARMKGWKTRSFSERRFQHHRPLGTAERSGLNALFSYGEKDYYLGGSPIWQLFRVIYRATKSPRIVGGLALFSGYLWAALRHTKRPVSLELMRFHRQEQMQKLRAILRSLLRRQKIDNFRVATEQ